MNPQLCIVVGRTTGKTHSLSARFYADRTSRCHPVIAVLASIALPAYTGIQERARVVQDMSNLRQLGLATQMYMNDNDGVIFATQGRALKCG